MTTPYHPQVAAQHVEHIVRCVLDATEEERTAGLLWYQTFGHAIRAEARQRGWEEERALALFAALSPMMPIRRNWKLFASALRRGTLKGQTGLLPHSRRKGEGLCNGSVAIEQATRGDKVGRFYRNLSGDETCVTIDRHAICAANNALDYNPCITHRQYLDLEAAYQVAAAQLEMSPAQCQAIAWIVWRRQHGAKDNGGMEIVT